MSEQAARADARRVIHRLLSQPEFVDAETALETALDALKIADQHDALLARLAAATHEVQRHESASKGGVVRLLDYVLTGNGWTPSDALPAPPPPKPLASPSSLPPDDDGPPEPVRPPQHVLSRGLGTDIPPPKRRGP
jgi:hypothetical protein